MVVEQKTVWVNCDYFNNKVVGLAAQPGGGGAVSAYNGGWGWFYMCKFVKNTAETHLAMGGMLFAYDSATLFFRDCIVAENIGYSGISITTNIIIITSISIIHLNIIGKHR